MPIIAAPRARGLIEVVLPDGTAVRVDAQVDACLLRSAVEGDPGAATSVRPLRDNSLRIILSDFELEPLPVYRGERGWPRCGR